MGDIQEDAVLEETEKIEEEENNEDSGNTSNLMLFGAFFALLLLSAVNTAMIALISLFFVMTRDGELPDFFQKGKLRRGLLMEGGISF